MKIAMLLLIALLACSETEERPLPESEPHVPVITIAERGYGWGRGFASETTLERSSNFWIASDIPMPVATYILVNDRLVRMEEGETEIKLVFTKTCPYLIPGYEHPRFVGEIKPAHHRFRHLPYDRGDISTCPMITASTPTRLESRPARGLAIGATEKWKGGRKKGFILHAAGSCVF